MAPNMTKKHLQINAMREDIIAHIPHQIEPELPQMVLPIPVNEWVQLPEVGINDFDHWVQLPEVEINDFEHWLQLQHADEVLDDIFNSFIEDWDLWMEEMDNTSD